ncbi:hypothetical protein DL96DRAFT_569805 [Flagelloscypha sp. PMI_526]|nr:hypothetical protein DL96DRAFT_569805 [Flagelloscypha sp. PMI_526]
MTDREQSPNHEHRYALNTVLSVAVLADSLSWSLLLFTTNYLLTSRTTCLLPRAVVTSVSWISVSLVSSPFLLTNLTSCILIGDGCVFPLLLLPLWPTSCLRLDPITYLLTLPASQHIPSIKN